jgi:DNA-binding HxlR family transcriptional regulator
MIASKSKARKSIPAPGQAVRGSTTGRPIMALLDLLGRRWTLRILWELRTGESLTFRELQARCAEVSSSVLSDRLRELRDAGIVTARPGQGYTLTREGARLVEDLDPLDGWAKRWARRTTRAARARATPKGPPIHSAPSPPE